ALSKPQGPGPLRVGVEDYRDNLRAMIDDSREEGANVILVLSPYLDLGHDQDWVPMHRRYKRVASAVAEEKGVPVVDVVDKLRFAPNLFMEPDTDQIHFNREAGRMIADRIAETVVEKFLPEPTDDEAPARAAGQ
ncbi:SGNH/GDSL hydrolase family protein, partial [bacterium]|nr:SGNH/GDSL hydrolase family protein [bacterium]